MQDLLEDSRRAPVSRLAPGYTVYRRPRMAEEGVPANAEGAVQLDPGQPVDTKLSSAQVVRIQIRYI